MTGVDGDKGKARKKAKPFLYAFLFGGGAGKLAIILTGRRDAKLGQQALDKFEDSIPGLKEIRDKIKKQYNRTVSEFGKEWGFIRGIDGRILFVDSEHKLLVSLLQALEALTCKAAAVYLKEKLIERGIEHHFQLHYHDEMAVLVPEQYKEEVAALSVEAFTEAPKRFGVMCMNGDANIGYNYAEVH